MKKILLPFDFSNSAIESFRCALDIAKRADAIVQLIYVIELSVLNGPILGSAQLFESKFLDNLKIQAAQKFETLNKKYNNNGVSVKFMLASGNIVQKIIHFTKEQKFDLIVMGTAENCGVKEFLCLNSVKIIRRSPVPVLIVRQYQKKAIKQIVFPNTLNLEQEGLIKKVKALQNFFDAHLNIVWINTPLTFASDVATYRRMEHFCRHFNLKNYSVHIFNHRNVEDGIIEFTKLINGNLIAMGTDGRKGIAHLFNGGVAENIVTHSEYPVWTYSNKKRTI